LPIVLRIVSQEHLFQGILKERVIEASVLDKAWAKNHISRARLNQNERRDALSCGRVTATPLPRDPGARSCDSGFILSSCHCGQVGVVWSALFVPFMYIFNYDVHVVLLLCALL